MVMGKVWEADSWQLGISGSFSYDQSGGYGPVAGGSSRTYFCPNEGETYEGVVIALHTDKDPLDVMNPNGKASVIVSIPQLALSTTVTWTEWKSSLSGRAVINSPTLYASPGTWTLRYESVQLFVNGTMTASGASGSISTTYFAPAGVPLIGIPADIQTQADANPKPAHSVPVALTTVSSSYLEVDTQIVGGWSFTTSGASSSLPVTLSKLAPPSVECTCTPDGLPELSATNTANAEVNAHYDLLTQVTFNGTVTCSSCTNGAAVVNGVYDIYKTYVEENQQNGSIVLIPDLPKSMKRFNNDYAAMIYRGGMPKGLRTATAVCLNYVTLEEDSEVISSPVNPRQSDYLGIVRNNTHAMEDTFAYATYAPYGLGSSRFTGTSYTSSAIVPIACPAGSGGPGPDDGTLIPCWDTVGSACEGSISSSFFGAEDKYTSDRISPRFLPYLYHEDNFIARYLNYWANPHWSFFYYFPPDNVGDPFSWNLYGSSAPASEYWIPIRTQYLYQPGISPAENSKTRTDLISAPLAEGGHGLFINEWVMGQSTSWWGINRFVPQSIPTKESVTLNVSSSGAWSVVGGTAVYGAGSVVVSPSSSYVIVDYDIGNFIARPYMLPHLANNWDLGYTANGISQGEFQLIGYDDVSLTLGTEGSGTVTGNYSWPSSRPFLKYAGTWGQMLGGIYDLTDIGADSKATGISSTLMADDEGVHALGLLTAYTGKKLRYTFTVTASSQSITIPYPTFNMSQQDPVFLYENGQAGALIRDNSSGIRFGQWSFWDYLLDLWLDVPEALSFASKTTVLDWLGFKRMALQGAAAASGLDSELASLYDSWEGQSRLNVAYDTTSFVLAKDEDLIGFLSNTMSECPPLACFPGRARNASWVASGAFVQESWSAAHEPRYLLSAGTQLDIFSPSGNKFTDTYGPTVQGWNITAHKKAVTNSEGVSFSVLAAGATGLGDRLALVSPWHGYLGTRGGDIESQPYLIQEELGRLYRVSITGTASGDVMYRMSNHSTPLPSWKLEKKITTTSDCSWPKMDIDVITRRIWLLYLRGSSLYSRYSDDDGNTWSATTTVSSAASFPSIAQNVKGDMLQGWIEGGDVKLRLREAQDQNFGSSFTMISSGGTINIGDSGFQILKGMDNQDRWWITLIGSDNRTIRTFFSTDSAATWKEFGTPYTSLQDVSEARMAIAVNGEMVRAWMKDDFTLGLQYFSSESTDWESAITPQGGSEGTMTLREFGFGGIAFAEDWQNRLSLTVAYTGDTLCSDWASTDNGSTFQRY